jgi:outer membrane protein OmpA-like peptidoglycan-associated protein
VQRYEPATDQWVALPAMPAPLSGAGAAIIDGQLLVAGGESTTSVSSTVLAYDLTAPTATWITLPSLKQGRHGLGVAAVGNTLYAIAGSTRAGHTASTNTMGALNVPPRRPHPAETDRAVLKAQLDQLLAAAPITFSPDEAALTSSGAETVEKVAVLLAPAAAAGIGVKLTGHTARTPGNPDRAEQLSEQRALAVAEALASKGVAAPRIQTEGVGDSVPKGDAATSRRVEIQLI